MHQLNLFIESICYNNCIQCKKICYLCIFYHTQLNNSESKAYALYFKVGKKYACKILSYVIILTARMCAIVCNLTMILAKHHLEPFIRQFMANLVKFSAIVRFPLHVYTNDQVVKQFIQTVMYYGYKWFLYKTKIFICSVTMKCVIYMQKYFLCDLVSTQALLKTKKDRSNREKTTRNKSYMLP